LTLLLSPGERQSKELLRKVLGVYHRLGRPVAADAENKLTLELANTSRIVALPGKEATIRGFSAVDVLVVDEAARVEDSLYHAIRPMLAVSQGKLVIMSTPFGQRGFFHREWTEGQGWERYHITAEQCPRISRQFLAEERLALGAWMFLQEYHGVFGANLDQVFPHDVVMRAITSDVKPFFGG
jgi:hypothetical protein